MSENNPKDYTRLQKNIDQVLGKIGLQRTVSLLDSFIQHVTIGGAEHEKTKMITLFLVNQAIREFDLESELFYICDVREYRDARICCFHLLRKYTGDTFSKIGLSFGCSERSVAYGYRTAAERLAMPKGNVKFVSTHASLESKLIRLIGNIN